jgi:hypothetical protein
VEIQLCELLTRRVWEYNSRGLPQKKYFENTIPHNCLRVNVARKQLRKVALKESVVRIQFHRISQSKYFKNTIPQNCLKGSVLRMQLHRVASMDMCWDATFANVPRRNFVGCNLRRVLQEELCWDATSAECPTKKFCWMKPLQSALERHFVLMTLTRGHDFDLGFFT